MLPTINKFFYNQKIFYAKKLEEIKFFHIKEMSTIESSIRLTNQNSGVGVLYCLKTGEFSFIEFEGFYNKWKKTTWAFVAISLEESEVLKILAKHIVSEQKEEIENLRIKIEKCWDLIHKAQTYL